MWDLGTVHKLDYKNWIRLIIPLLNVLGVPLSRGFRCLRRMLCQASSMFLPVRDGGGIHCLSSSLAGRWRRTRRRRSCCLFMQRSRCYSGGQGLEACWLD